MKHFSGLNDSELHELLKTGAVGILPTDTVYGLVCGARNQQSVERLYALKRRESKPGAVIAASIEQLVNLGIKERYLKPVAHYWPNPISVVIPNYELTYLHQGVGSLAMRIPSHKDLQKLLSVTGPLLTSSANQPGEPEAATIAQATAYFGDSIDFYADGGDLSGRQASTVIRIVDDAVEVLREGAIKLDEAGRIINEP